MIKKYLTYEIAIAACAVIAFAAWLVPYLRLDYWNDEIFSLQYYVFVPLQKILADYTLPNNHIFFNLLNYAFVRLFSIPDINTLLAHPVWLRAFMGIYVILTLLYLVRTAAKFFNPFVAAAAVIILFTTLPYINFAVQLRGYSLSMALSAMLLFYTWSYAQTPRWRYALLLLISASLLLYTIPSNIYLVASLLILYAGLGLANLYRNILRAPGFANLRVLIHAVVRDHSIQTAAILALSCVVSLLVYLPALSTLINFAGSTQSTSPNLGTLVRLLPKTLKYFLSLRYVLIPIAALGTILFFIRTKNQLVQPARRYALICLYLLVTPYLLSALRGDAPFDRIFIYETLIFSLFTAAACYQAGTLLRLPDHLKHPLFLLLLLVYCQVCFFAAFRERDQHILNDISNESQSQDIFYNYFQYRYTPLQTVTEISRRQDLGPIHVYRLGDPVSALAYLNLFSIDYIDMHTVEDLTINPAGKNLVLTSTPADFQSHIAQIPTIHCDPFNTLSHVSVFSCQRIP